MFFFGGGHFTALHLTPLYGVDKPQMEGSQGHLHLWMGVEIVIDSALLNSEF